MPATSPRPFSPFSIFLALAVILLLPPHVRAAESGGVRLKTTEAAVFKDGYALIKKSGAGILNERGELYIDDVPEAAVLGTFLAIPGAIPGTHLNYFASPLVKE